MRPAACRLRVSGARGLRALCVLAALGGGVVSGAHAQDESLYRADQPAVLSKAASAPAAPDLSGFAGAYLRQGRPALLVMWHKELSATPVTGGTQQIDLQSRGVMPWDNYDQVLQIQWQHDAPSVVSFATPPDAAEFETAFFGVMQQHGVVLVSRAAALRQTAAKATPQSLNTLESQALSSLAGYFIEIRFVKNGQCRATVTSTQDAHMVADVLSKADEGRETRWGTDDKGFVKRSEAPTMAAQGRQLALKVLASLQTSWR